jgi:adenylate cyclase
VGIRIADPSFVENVRLKYFDELITAKAPTENNIYTVNIDEDTITKYGQYPFPRDVYAKIIEDLYKRNAGLVVFNVLLSEEDRFGKDRVLAETMNKFPVILPNTPENKNKNTPRKPSTVVIGAEHSHMITQYAGIMANVPVLESRAVGTGTIHTEEENDNVVRRMPLVIAVDGVVYPSIAMEALRVAAGDSTTQIKLFEGGVEKMRIPKFGPIATDERGRVWIDWSQRSKSASAVNLPKDFAGAVVIVGVAATGLGNPVPTPVQGTWPQDVQAAVLGTMINGVTIQRPDYAAGVEILALVGIGILLIFLSRWTYVGIGATVVTIGAIVPGTIYAFNNWLVLADATAITFGLIIVALHCYGVKFISEFLQKQAIKKQFAGYASPTVVRLLQENPDLIKKGQKKEVSILFSDLRGFTPLGESFGDDVAGLTKIMNGYMDAITQPVLDADGMIIKYIGDASMHIHNAPIEDLDHPATAVRTGLKMLKAVEKFNEEIIIPQGRPAVGMGAGINTGLGYIGEMGSTARHSYDVLGDAVSTAARIESKCKEYGCLLLVGGATVDRCKDKFFFLKIDDLAVKGKTVGVAIYTVLDPDVTVAADYLLAQEMHNNMHSLYRQQKWNDAIALCEELKEEFDGQMEKYYDMWIERCEFQKTQKLPKDWNGVFIATSK